MARLIVIAGPVEHDGAVFQDGDELPDVSDDLAQPLVAGGACSALLDAPAPAKQRKPKELPAAE